MRFWGNGICLAVLLSAQGVVSWGGLGHRTVGYLAQKHLTDDAAIMVAELLKNNKGYDISDATTWADAVRYRYPESRKWHYIGELCDPVRFYEILQAYRVYTHTYFEHPDAEDDPPNNCSVNYKRDCNSNGQPGCIVSAFIDMTKLVANRESRSPYGEKEALMFVLHFIGDMHQPLHIEEEDRGGNGIKVCFDDRCGRTNLHSVWDTDIPYKYRGLHHGIHKQEEREAAALWAEELYTQQITNGTDIDIECSNVRAAQHCALTWATEANSYICSYVLAKGEAWLKENDLGGDYYEGAAPIVEKMIAKAGLRLGAWLNALAEVRSADVGLFLQQIS